MIIVVRSEFCEDITSALESGALSVLDAQNIEYKLIRVPGAVEVPVTCQRAIMAYDPDAVIALGCIIKGETDHYDAVLRSVTDGLTRIALDFDTPVIQGVLPVQVRKSAENRKNLGKEWAQTAIEMIKIFNAHPLE